jgi:hypothetical protein
MVARILATMLALLLAFYAFWADVLGGGHFLNPSGIMFLLLAAFVWLGWRTIRAAYLSARDESDIPIIRLGSAIIRGMRRPPRQHRNSDEPA